MSSRTSIWASRLDLKPHRTMLSRWLARNFRIHRGCWVYSGRQRREYPIKSWRVKGDAYVIPLHILAARLWCYAGRPIPLGQEIHHTCGNTWCYNPDHLDIIPASQHRELHREERSLAREWKYAHEANTWFEEAA